MNQLNRVIKMKDVKKGSYFVERHVTKDKDVEKVRAFILGACPGCGTQLVGEIDLSQEAKEMPCFNKECNYKFIYKDNSLFSF